MNTVKLLIYIVVMMVVTYGLRVLPLILFRKPIKSSFVRSFLHYIPYAVLGAMTFPAVLYSTGVIYAGLAGLVVGIILALCKRSLFTVALGSCIAALIVQYLSTVL